MRTVCKDQPVSSTAYVVVADQLHTMTTDYDSDYTGYVNDDEFPTPPLLDGKSSSRPEKDGQTHKVPSPFAEPEYGIRSSRYTTLRKQDTGDLYDLVTVNSEDSVTPLRPKRKMSFGKHLSFRVLSTAFLVIAVALSLIGLSLAVSSFITSSSSSDCDCQALAREMEDLKRAVIMLGELNNVTLNL